MIPILTEMPSRGAVVFFGWYWLKKKSSVKSKTIDALSHALNPPMEVLSEAEKGKVLKKYGIDETQLPAMPHNDPVAVALKAEPGNIVKIRREEETGKYVTFKIVV